MVSIKYCSLQLLYFSFQLLTVKNINCGVLTNRFNNLFDLTASAAEPRPVIADFESPPTYLPLNRDAPAEASQKVEKYLRRPIAFSYNQPSDVKLDNAKSETVIYPEKQIIEVNTDDNQDIDENTHENLNSEENVHENDDDKEELKQAEDDHQDLEKDGEEKTFENLQEDKAEHKAKSGGGGGGGAKKHGKPHKEKHKKGGGKSHHADHHSTSGEKGDKGYKGHHTYEKTEKGHHDKEAHKKSYSDKGGKKKKHFHEDGYFGEHNHGEKGEKEHKYSEAGEHKKGHTTKGEHNIHKKDEYEKKQIFFDEDHEDGESEKHGGFSVEHEFKKGGYEKGGHKKGGKHEDHYGKKGHAEKGGHFADEKGHKKAGGHDTHYHHGSKYGKKGGKEGGKKWSFKKGSGSGGGGGGGGGKKHGGGGGGGKTHGHLQEEDGANTNLKYKVHKEIDPKGFLPISQLVPQEDKSELINQDRDYYVDESKNAKDYDDIIEKENLEVSKPDILNYPEDINKLQDKPVRKYILPLEAYVKNNDDEKVNEEQIEYDEIAEIQNEPGIVQDEQVGVEDENADVQEEVSQECTDKKDYNEHAENENIQDKEDEIQNDKELIHQLEPIKPVNEYEREYVGNVKIESNPREINEKLPIFVEDEENDKKQTDEANLEADEDYEED